MSNEEESLIIWSLQKIQATAIKVELQNHSKVAHNGFTTMTISNDIEMLTVSQKLTEYQNKRITELTAKE